MRRSARRPRGQDDGRRTPRRLRRSGRRGERGGSAPARSVCDRRRRRHRVQDPLRTARRHRPRARRRLFRCRRQPGCPDHGCGERRSSAALAERRRPGPASVSRRDRLPSPGPGPAPRSDGSRGCLAATTRGPAAGLSRAALARFDSQQPAPATHELHRPRARHCRRQVAARQDPPPHPDRCGRLRQDASRAAGCGGTRRIVPGRRLAGRAGGAGRPGSRPADDGVDARAPRGDGPEPDAGAAGPLAVAEAPARTRQRRARARRLRGAGGRDPPPWSPRPRALHEPRSAWQRRRDSLPRSVTVAARSTARRDTGASCAERLGAALRRTGSVERSALRGDRGQRGGARVDLREARRHPARDRTRCGTRALDARRGSQPAPRPATAASHRRLAHRAAAAPDAALADRLELRPPRRTRARAPLPARRLRRGRGGGRRHRGLRQRGHRRVEGARPRDLARRQEPRADRGVEQREPLPDARDRAPVCEGEATGRRRSPLARLASRLFHAHRRGGRDASFRRRSAGMVQPPRTGARQSASGADVGFGRTRRSGERPPARRGALAVLVGARLSDRRAELVRRRARGLVRRSGRRPGERAERRRRPRARAGRLRRRASVARGEPRASPRDRRPRRHRVLAQPSRERRARARRLSRRGSAARGKSRDSQGTGRSAGNGHVAQQPGAPRARARRLSDGAALPRGEPRARSRDRRSSSYCGFAQQPGRHGRRPGRLRDRVRTSRGEPRDPARARRPAWHRIVAHQPGRRRARARGARPRPRAGRRGPRDPARARRPARHRDFTRHPRQHRAQPG